MTMYELRLVHLLPSNRRQLENNDNLDLQQLSEVIVNVSLIKVFCKISIYIWFASHYFFYKHVIQNYLWAHM